MRIMTNEQSPFDIDILLFEKIEFMYQRFGVKHNSVAYYACNVVTQNPLRNKMKDKFLFTNFYSVSRVRPALVANNNFIFFAENIDDFPFPFVAPLTADQNGNAHKISFKQVLFFNCQFIKKIKIFCQKHKNISLGNIVSREKPLISFK